MLYRIICNLISKQTATQQMLGRWHIKTQQPKQEQVTVFWANSDHCGDSICGDPKKNKEILQNMENNSISKS